MYRFSRLNAVAFCAALFPLALSLGSVRAQAQSRVSDDYNSPHTIALSCSWQNRLSVAPSDPSGYHLHFAATPSYAFSGLIYTPGKMYSYWEGKWTMKLEVVTTSISGIVRTYEFDPSAFYLSGYGANAPDSKDDDGAYSTAGSPSTFAWSPASYFFHEDMTSIINSYYINDISQQSISIFPRTTMEGDSTWNSLNGGGIVVTNFRNQTFDGPGIGLSTVSGGM